MEVTLTIKDYIKQTQYWVYDHQRKQIRRTSLFCWGLKIQLIYKYNDFTVRIFLSYAGSLNNLAMCQSKILCNLRLIKVAVKNNRPSMKQWPVNHVKIQLTNESVIKDKKVGIKENTIKYFPNTMKDVFKMIQ